MHNNVFHRKLPQKELVNLFLRAGISSIWDLKEQSQIRYGTVQASSVEQFFRSQEQMLGHYKAFYETMSFPENQVSSFEMGLERVRDSFGKPKRK